MKAIGPNFVNEMVAAGVSLAGIAWGVDGQINFAPYVTQQTRDAVAAVYAAHDPATPDQRAVRLSVDDSDAQACLADATIMSLVNQDRATWRAWASANFPTLTAPEKTRLGDLFWVVAIGVRRRLRG